MKLDKIFHAVVIMGAALTAPGCGGGTTADAGSDTGARDTAVADTGMVVADASDAATDADPMDASDGADTFVAIL